MPNSWRMVKLGDCLQRRKETVIPSTITDASVGLVGLEDIQDGGRGGITVQSISPQEIQSLKTRFRPGDILYGKLRPYLNKVGITQQAGLCSTEIWAFGSNELVDSQYAAFFLASSFFVDRVASLTKGANLPRLDTKAFDSIDIPLPPLSEQQWIVEILQETEEIRRLRAEAKAKTAELVPAMFEGFFGNPVVNPKSWTVEPLASLINDTPKNGLYKPADLYGHGTPIIRIGDFTGGILRTTKNLQRLRISDEEIEQFEVTNGQILINRVNSIEHLGKSLLIASLTEPTVYESNMIRLDPKKEKVLPEFLVSCLQHGSIVAKLRAKAKKAINQASINQTDVLTLTIPVPPLEKQQTFVSQVSQSEDVRILAETSLGLKRAMNASLSAHAFSGQLTADWREAHANILSTEARERDAAFKEAGAIISHSRRATIQGIDQVFEQRTDGIYSDLNREQRELLFRIQQQVGGVDYGRYFTADSVAGNLEGPLHRNAKAVESHLLIFATRGLIVPVSRMRNDNLGNQFAACYRLVLPEDDIRDNQLEHQRRLATGNI